MNTKSLMMIKICENVDVDYREERMNPNKFGITITFVFIYVYV